MTPADLSSTVTCKNCQVTFEGKFCPNCSQKADTHRFSLLHFVHETIHAITHTDRGIFFLMKELITKPGKVAIEYNSGMRKKYFNPITFLLIMTAIQIFVAKKTGFFEDFTKAIRSVTEQVTSQASAEDLQRLKEQDVVLNKQLSFADDNNKVLRLLFIPILSFFTWGFFKKSGHNFAENLVFNVMINGEIGVFFLVFAILPFLIFPSLVILWLCLFFFLSWVYNLIAYKQFYKQRWFGTILKGMTVQLLYIICVQQLTGLISAVF